MLEYGLGIVGGSASGLAAAISAKRKNENLKIVIFEQLPRTGKKILATGNGRCNLTNTGALSHPYRNAGFAMKAIGRYPPERVTEFFRSLGLETYTDSEGRVYPRSNTAASVLDALRYEILRQGTEIVKEYKVTEIKPSDGGFTVNGEIWCEKLIIACGGKSSPSQGSDGSGYPLAKSLGHSVTQLVPALVPLNTKPEKVKSVKGIRAGGVCLTLEGRRSEAQACGEILFTDSGISGIAAMELASFAERELRTGFDPVLHIDFLPEMTDGELTSFINNLCKIREGEPFEHLLTGLLAKPLGILVMKDAGIFDPSGKIGEFSVGMTEKLVSSMKDYQIGIFGTRGFANAQVTSGGVDVSEIDAETMKSLIRDNLYFCGEITDVDGGCGGFNLQWAFASGLTAGELND
ncbi:MAG: NAD(P)/FAD-dependent oxidoreductase [Clostridia bacterium]|nr:NAD(P)/FAD-dependent oxidoreductase [Clostridia bacterium]